MSQTLRGTTSRSVKRFLMCSGNQSVSRRRYYEEVLRLSVSAFCVFVYMHVLQVMEDGQIFMTPSSASRTVRQNDEDDSQEERKNQGHFPRWVFGNGVLSCVTAHINKSETFP